MDCHSEEKELLDLKRGEAAKKYATHFDYLQKRDGFICTVTGIGMAVLAARFTNQVGYRLTTGAIAYMGCQKGLDYRENARVRTEVETGERTFERLALSEQEFEFLRGQLGPNAKYLDRTKYVDVEKPQGEEHLSYWT